MNTTTNTKAERAAELTAEMLGSEIAKLMEQGSSFTTATLFKTNQFANALFDDETSRKLARQTWRKALLG